MAPRGENGYIWLMAIESPGLDPRRRRVRRIPVRTLAPNIVTLLAMCAGLRLARFNVVAEEPDRPAWASNFFVGVPAPMGAIGVLLPIYVVFLGVPRSSFLIWSTLFYTLAIALLMVSRLPVFSGKPVGTRVPPEMVGPLIVVMVLWIGLLMAYPWIMLTVGTLAYLASLPFGWLSYRRYQRRSREA